MSGGQGALPRGHPLAILRRHAAACADLAATIEADDVLATDSAWIAERIRRFDADPAAGLDVAFDLQRLPGRPWWKIEPTAMRDEMLRRAHREFFPEKTAGEAAKGIAAACRRLERRTTTPTGLEALLALAGQHAAVPGSERRLRQILAGGDLVEIK
jgi:hypothetical protein